MIKDWVFRIYVNDVVGINEFDEVVGYGVFGVVLIISFDVVEIIDMVSFIGGSIVGFVVRVDYMYLLVLIIVVMLFLGFKFIVRVSGGVVVGVVIEGVDVEVVFCVGVVFGNVLRDGGGGVFVGLFEGYGVGDFGVIMEDVDCMLESFVSDD